LDAGIHQDLDENRHIAAQLREAAQLLDGQGDNAYRVAAYLRAADTVEHLERPLRALFDTRGRAGLEELPGIGSGIAAAIAEMLVTGAWSQLARLRGSESEVIRFPQPPAPVLPDVATLLDVDAEYRAKAAAGRLRTIAPRRFNPEGRSWLPVLHARRGPWHFTALYSNTARAHDLGRTHDWVVIYFYDGDQQEHQCTVVTETRGALAGLRVVRGREAECRDVYPRRSA
jgi:hypothetical protein